MVVNTTPREDDETRTALEEDPRVTRAAAEVDDEATAEVMGLLQQHVPLALLADLVNPDGPASPAILESEGLPDVAWWGPGPGTEAAAEGAAADEPEASRGAARDEGEDDARGDG